MDDEPEEIMWQGRFIEARRRGRWEYVGRARSIRAAVILAMDSGKVILVEQYRVPLQARCLELPAGLVGDEQAGEAVEAAAARELEEETGFRAGRLVTVGKFSSSPGMVSETFTLLVASDLQRVGEGGGLAGEDIVVHQVPLAEIPSFVAEARARGLQMDVKLLLLLSPAILAEAARQA